jgi:tRNA(Ile)-lysidine synthase
VFEQIETILREQCGLVRNRPVIAGISGGPDSLCLLEVLRQAGYSVVVAHFNHRLRPESDEEAAMVGKTAGRMQIPSVIDGADVRAYAEQQGVSIEEAARTLRYRFLFNLARQHQAQAVAVGHTADDQVETVLMHFLRGSGMSGLKGMSHRSILEVFDPEIPLVRPLLDVWRKETLAFCDGHDLHPHFDASNESLDYQRNRIRHRLIPDLEGYNPKFRAAVLRMTQSLKLDHAFLNEMVEAAWKESAAEVDDKRVAFDLTRLSKSPVGLQRNLVRKAMLQLRPGLEVDFAALERASKMIPDLSGPSDVDLKGGLRLFREGGRIYVCATEADLPVDLWPQMPAGRTSLPVPVPGRVELSSGWILTCDRWQSPLPDGEQVKNNEDPFQVWVDADRMSAPPEVRVRRDGDLFAPLGMEGHSQKLSDFFVNEKLPERRRERWPLLCSGETILWVPGYRPAHAVRLTSSTRNALYFVLRNTREEPGGSS